MTPGCLKAFISTQARRNPVRLYSFGDAKSSLEVRKVQQKKKKKNQREKTFCPNLGVSKEEMFLQRQDRQ